MERPKDKSSRRLKFTENALRALPLPAAGQVTYSDTATQGFVCRLTPTARTLYVIRRQRGAGKVVFMRLGVVGDKPLAEYKIDAETKSATLASGQVPATDMPKRGALTLSRALTQYLEAKQGKLALSTVAAYKADFNGFAGSWTSRTLASLTADEVAKRHRERSLQSPARADGALRVLRAVVRYAQASASARGERLDIDPLALIRAGGSWNNVARRRTYLAHDRRAEWLTAVLELPDDKGNTLSGTQRDALLLIAATGLRLRESLGLTWGEVNLEARTVALGAERMKGGVGHKLPLSRRTLQLLKRRRAADPEATHVFPGPKDGKPLDRISRNTFAAIPFDFTPHDLRRTIATWLGANAPAYVVKAILSHADPSKSADVTAGYVVLDPEALRPWLQQWEDELYQKRRRVEGK